jgi:hypothetical protein
VILPELLISRSLPNREIAAGKPVFGILLIDVLVIPEPKQTYPFVPIKHEVYEVP